LRGGEDDGDDDENANSERYMRKDSGPEKRREDA